MFEGEHFGRRRGRLQWMVQVPGRRHAANDVEPARTASAARTAENRAPAGEGDHLRHDRDGRLRAARHHCPMLCALTMIRAFGSRSCLTTTFANSDSVVSALRRLSRSSFDGYPRI